MSPVFAHGQLRLYLLALLAEGPRHGYEIIQALEQRFGGLYSPSAGTVYPRLAKLEEEGLVERSDEGRKATYRITRTGLDEVAGRQDEIDNLQRDLDSSVRRLAEQVRSSVHGSSADLRAELHEAARRARADAVPVGSGEAGSRQTGPRREHGWNLSDARDVGPQIEQAMSGLRDQARQSWRSGNVTPEQIREILDIVSDASARIAVVLKRPPA